MNPESGKTGCIILKITGSGCMIVRLFRIGMNWISSLFYIRYLVYNKMNYPGYLISDSTFVYISGIRQIYIRSTPIFGPPPHDDPLCRGEWGHSNTLLQLAVKQEMKLCLLQGSHTRLYRGNGYFCCENILDFICSLCLRIL